MPETLVRLLGEHACPPLNEFYELVLQAQAARVLVPDNGPEEVSLARRWPLRLPVNAAGWLENAALLASLVALVMKPWSGRNQQGQALGACCPNRRRD